MMKFTIIAGVEVKYNNITHNLVNIPQFGIKNATFPRLHLKTEVFTRDEFVFDGEENTPFLEISLSQLKWTCWKSEDGLLYTCLTNVEARENQRITKSISRLNVKTREIHTSLFVDKLRQHHKNELLFPFSTIGHDYYFACYLIGAKFAILNAVLYEYKGKMFLDFRDGLDSMKSRSPVNLLSDQKICLFADLNDRIYIQNLPTPSNESILTFRPIIEEISGNRSGKIYAIFEKSDLPVSLQLLQHSSQPYWDKDLMNSFISFLHLTSEALSFPS